MALPFTGTPVEIRPASPFLWNVDNGSIQGPFTYGGAIWIAGTIDPAPNCNCTVAKSTDNGATWTVYSQAAPTIRNIFPQIAFDSTNGIFYFVGSDTGGGSGHIRVVRFNIGTLAFLANVDSTFTYVSDSAFPVLRPNGDIRIIYGHSGAAPADLGWVAFTAGAFGSPQTLDAGIGTQKLAPMAVCCGSSGIIHVAYSSPSTSDILYYIALSAADSPGTRQQISTTGGQGLFGNALIWNDRLIFTQGWVSTSTAIGQGNKFYEGTPVSAPVWATKQLPTYVGTNKQEMVVVDATSVDGDLWFLYNETADLNPSTIVNCMRCRYDGVTIAAQELVWDIKAHPPVPGLTFQDTDGLTAAISPTGVLQIAVTTAIDIADNLTACYFEVATCTATTVTLTGPLPTQTSTGTDPHSFILPTGVGGLTYPYTGTLDGSGTGGSGGPTQQGLPVTITSTHTGGPDAYTFQLISGNLPDGVYLTVADGSGVISSTVHDLLASGIGQLLVVGTPATPGGVTTYQFVIRHTYTI